MIWLKKAVLFIVLMFAPVLSDAKVFLVSVGVSDYPGVENDLALPVEDAKTITWLYSKNDDMQYCQLLNEDATKSKIKAAMNKVFKEAGRNDIVVFYFSGHGYAGGFCAHDGFISYKEIRESMSTSKSKNKMIFADACFSGKIRTGGRTDEKEIIAAQRNNVMLFLSSRSNELSIEIRGMKNGLFTTFLQLGLRGDADENRDRIITAKELFDYVHIKVIQRSNNRQHPVMWGNFADDMPVMVWK